MHHLDAWLVDHPEHRRAGRQFHCGLRGGFGVRHALPADDIDPFIAFGLGKGPREEAFLLLGEALFSSAEALRTPGA